MHTLSDRLRWDDVRLLLAVLRTRSFSAASQQLGVEQSTVSRRIAALEQALQQTLFDRVPQGLVPTEMAHALGVHAERVETEMLALVATAERRERAPQGRVRLAVADSFAVLVVVPHVLPALSRSHPALSVDILSSDSAFDLSRREADLALRFFRPPTGDLVCKRIGVLETAVIGDRSYVASRSHRPHALDWINVELPGVATPEAHYLAAHVSVEPKIRTNSYLAQVEAVRAGLGVALMVRSLLHFDPQLTEVDLGLPPTPSLELWLAAASNVRNVPRVDAVWSWLETEIPNILQGRSQSAVRRSF